MNQKRERVSPDGTPRQVADPAAVRGPHIDRVAERAARLDRAGEPQALDRRCPARLDVVRADDLVGVDVGPALDERDARAALGVELRRRAAGDARADDDDVEVRAPAAHRPRRRAATRAPRRCRATRPFSIRLPGAGASPSWTARALKS